MPVGMGTHGNGRFTGTAKALAKQALNVLQDIIVQGIKEVSHPTSTSSVLAWENASLLWFVSRCCIPVSFLRLSSWLVYVLNSVNWTLVTFSRWTSPTSMRDGHCYSPWLKIVVQLALQPGLACHYSFSYDPLGENWISITVIRMVPT